MIKLGRYRKFIMAICGFVAVVGASSSDGEVTLSEAAAIMSAAAAAVGVFRVTNAPMKEVEDSHDS